MWEGSCLKAAGGGLRSISTRLCCGLSDERSWAVAKPMPEEPPVITMVFGVDFRVVKDAMFGWRRDMVGMKLNLLWLLYEGC